VLLCFVVEEKPQKLKNEFVLKSVKESGCCVQSWEKAKAKQKDVKNE